MFHWWTTEKYEYSPGNVRKNNLKCGHKYEYIPRNVRKNNLKCGDKYEYILGNVRKSNLKCGSNFVLDELVLSGCCAIRCSVAYMVLVLSTVV